MNIQTGSEVKRQALAKSKNSTRTTSQTRCMYNEPNEKIRVFIFDKSTASITIYKR